MGSLDEDSVGSTIVGGDGDSFVEKTMEVFDTDSFMIATSSNVNIDIEDGADFVKETFESTAVVDRNQTAEANFQKDFLN
jgi:hypothetical protein